MGGYHKKIICNLPARMNASIRTPLHRAYLRLGKTAAALKALQRARELGAAVAWELGSAQGESGLLEEAAATLRGAMVVGEEGGEDGVLVRQALGRTCLQLAYARWAEGFAGRALAAVGEGVAAVLSTTDAAAAVRGGEVGGFSSLYKLLGRFGDARGAHPCGCCWCCGGGKRGGGRGASGGVCPGGGGGGGGRGGGGGGVGQGERWMIRWMDGSVSVCLPVRPSVRPCLSVRLTTPAPPKHRWTRASPGWRCGGSGGCGRGRVHCGGW